MYTNYDAQFVEIANTVGLNPAFLKDILRLRSLGYNNTEIAQLSGISRVTVNHYLDELKQQENREAIGKLIVLCMAIYLGAKVLDEIFKG